MLRLKLQAPDVQEKVKGKQSYVLVITRLLNTDPQMSVEEEESGEHIDGGGGVEAVEERLGARVATK
jgi:hypothetical protein